MRTKTIYNMKEKFQAIAFQGSGLVCDNSECDYEYDVQIDVKDLHNFIDAECPKCKENLLTQEDHNHHVLLHKFLRLINIIFWPYMFLKGGRTKEDDESVLKYHYHDGKTTIEKGAEDERI